MKRTRRVVYGLGIAAALVFFAAWLFTAAEIFGGGMDPDRILPAAYVMAGAFVVLVPCLLSRIYVKFDRRYRSEQKSNPTEETK